MSRLVRGQAGIVLTVVLVLSVISVLIVLVVVSMQEGKRQEEGEKEKVPLIEMFLRAKSGGDFLAADFLVNADTVIRSGAVRSDAFAPVMVPRDQEIVVKCRADGYYLSRGLKLHTSQELDLNRSVYECELEKVGVLGVGLVSGDLSRRDNLLVFNLSSGGGVVKDVGVCLDWSIGVLRASTRTNIVECEFGSWKNHTRFYAENGSYDFLPEGLFVCGSGVDSRIEGCSSRLGNKCFLGESEFPERFRRSFNYCQETGVSLVEGGSALVEVDVRTIENKNRLDYVEVVFYDQDLTFDSDVKVDGDVGASDVKVRVHYTN